MLCTNWMAKSYVMKGMDFYCGKCDIKPNVYKTFPPYIICVVGLFIISMISGSPLNMPVYVCVVAAAGVLAAVEGVSLIVMAVAHRAVGGEISTSRIVQLISLFVV